jgi:hypothetical protein
MNTTGMSFFKNKEVFTEFVCAKLTKSLNNFPFIVMREHNLNMFEHSRGTQIKLRWAHEAHWPWLAVHRHRT